MAIDSLLLAGCGKMGNAMLAGWVKATDRPKSITIVEPSAGSGTDLDEISKHDDALTVVKSMEELPSDFHCDVMILAVKPQQMDAVLPKLFVQSNQGALAVSIAAGKTISYFRSFLGETARVIRTMPNTPAAVGRGITALSAGPGVDADDRRIAEQLLSSVGETVWVDSEEQLDAVTALSGGGPAYVFLLIEVLAQAGVEAGLPPHLAMRLARTTVCGSGELARLSDEAASTLRQNVTSPGGTTKAALDVLMAEGALQPLITRAIAAATARSKELAG
ncbi:MAG: pyrroline-5-carboxylate reductase [Pseudomonadota bacterium]